MKKNKDSNDIPYIFNNEINLQKNPANLSFKNVWENLESCKEFIESDNYLEYFNNLLYSNQCREKASIAETFNSKINIYTRNIIRTKKLLYMKEPQIRSIINENINN